MILPIHIYGHPVLRKTTRDISHDYPDLKELLENMYETMAGADGVGLAAPQIGREDRILVVDLNSLAKDDPSLKGFRGTFINAHVMELDGEEELMEEGCLSIPGIHEKVLRKGRLRLQYLDEDFRVHDEVFEGYKARVLQHELDHLDGVMFTDRISGIRKQMIRSKLNRLMEGRTNCSYRVRTVIQR
ncbi:MAG: peptide deformylase [Dysgonamonadaceae bacterium]|jgi:peptide deformylase|nr:peptide deformylase [Dysgonamonadaceae bacterium]